MLGAWVAVVAATAALSAGLSLASVPSATLFAALVVGLAVALSGRPRARDGRVLQLPAPAGTAGQAVLGVLSGALVQPSTLAALGADWLPVLAAVLATLAVSTGAGLLLGLHRDVDPVTGSFALVAGGASGLTAIAAELGADQRIVAVVQYLRVLVIVLAMPAVAVALPAGGAAGGGGAAAAAGAGAPLWLDLLFTAGVAALGTWLARLARLPAGALLGPMLVAVGLAATGLSRGATVPGPLVDLASALIGLQVGLSFTRESVTAVRRVLPAAVGCILLVVVATALVGVPLLHLAGATVLDGYLATTPGGLYAVLATAASTGADTTLVLAVQVLRLVVMLLLAPLISVALTRGRAPRRPRA